MRSNRYITLLRGERRKVVIQIVFLTCLQFAFGCVGGIFWKLQPQLTIDPIRFLWSIVISAGPFAVWYLYDTSCVRYYRSAPSPYSGPYKGPLLLLFTVLAFVALAFCNRSVTGVHITIMFGIAVAGVIVYQAYVFKRLIRLNTEISKERTSVKVEAAEIEKVPTAVVPARPQPETLPIKTKPQ